MSKFDLPIMEIDLGNTTDPSQPRVRIVNWNTVNCAELYSDSSVSDADARITRITLQYNNSSRETFNGEIACDNFLHEFQQKMGMEFKTFAATSRTGSSSHVLMHQGGGASR